MRRVQRRARSRPVVAQGRVRERISHQPSGTCAPAASPFPRWRAVLPYGPRHATKVREWHGPHRGVPRRTAQRAGRRRIGQGINRPALRVLRTAAPPGRTADRARGPRHAPADHRPSTMPRRGPNRAPSALLSARAVPAAAARSYQVAHGPRHNHARGGQKWRVLYCGHTVSVCPACKRVTRASFYAHVRGLHALLILKGLFDVRG